MLMIGGDALEPANRDRLFLRRPLRQAGSHGRDRTCAQNSGNTFDFQLIMYAAL